MGIFSCEQCDKTFGSADDLRTHVETHNNANPSQFVEVAPEVFVPSTPAASNNSDSTRDNDNNLSASAGNAGLCDAEIQRKMQFQCRKCDDQFKTLKELHEHLQSVHTVDGLICSECKVEFVGKIRLYRHWIKDHKESYLDSFGPRFLKCRFCPKTYQRSIDLYRHKHEKHRSRIFR